MDEFQSRLATIIRSRRQDMKMSQEELADRIGKTPSFIGQLERNDSSPSLDTLRAIINHLGIDANDVFSSDGISHEAYDEIYAMMLHMDEKKQQLLLEIARLLFKSNL